MEPLGGKNPSVTMATPVTSGSRRVVEVLFAPTFIAGRTQCPRRVQRCDPKSRKIMQAGQDYASKALWVFLKDTKVFCIAV